MNDILTDICNTIHDDITEYLTEVVKQKVANGETNRVHGLSITRINSITFIKVLEE